MAAFAATLYDGRTAAPHPCLVETVQDRLIVRTTSGEPLGEWPLAGICITSHARDGQPGRIALDPTGDARLAFTDPRLAADLIVIDRRIGGDRVGQFRRGVRRIAIPLALAIGGIVLLFSVVLPALAPVVARQIPEAAELRLGAATAEAVIALLADRGVVRLCDARAGRAALDALVAKLAATRGMPAVPRVRVVNSALVNAFALPGGEVLVMRGLIEFAQSPDELAGVLAHEFGHLALRHPLEVAIERTTASAVIGLIFGDVIGLSVVGGIASQLVANAYSRDAEAAADAWGLALMRDASIDGRAFAAFMARAGAQEAQQGGGLPGLLSTHPAHADRAATAGRDAWPSTPALDPAQWRALRAICGSLVRPGSRG